MPTSTVLPPLTATYPATYPASCIVASVPQISANQVKAVVSVKLSPIDALLSLQFSPTVNTGGTFGTAPNNIVIAATATPLYDGTQFSYIFPTGNGVVYAAEQAVAWTTAAVAAITASITAMRATDAAVVLPPGATLFTV